MTIFEKEYGNTVLMVVSSGVNRKGNVMKKIGLYTLILILAGCGLNEEGKRVKALQEMPVLWESEILLANADMPDLDIFVAMFDSYDGSLAEMWTKDKFTEDYIPESVMAFATETYRNVPRKVTIQLGDTVSILACKENNTGEEVCLVRTAQDTYAWIFSFHLLDKNGERMRIRDFDLR
jgi:hypothetical protein